MSGRGGRAGQEPPGRGRWTSGGECRAKAEYLTLTESRGLARACTGHDHVPQGVQGGPPFLGWSERERLGRGVRGVCGAVRPRGPRDSDLPSLLDAQEVDNVVRAVVKQGVRGGLRMSATRAFLTFETQFAVALHYQDGERRTSSGAIRPS